MVLRRELLRGHGRLNATITVLQRARLTDPVVGMWEAADLQWWWRRPLATDELALPVWFDEVGRVAAAGLTARANSWQADVSPCRRSSTRKTFGLRRWNPPPGHRGEALQVLVCEDDAPLAGLAIQSGFAMINELSGTAWMDADSRPPVSQVDGFAIVDRVTRADRSHPMIARNGELVEPRPRQCSLYDPTLDLAVEDADGRVRLRAVLVRQHNARRTPRTDTRRDEYQRRGLARMLLTNGLDRLARKGHAASRSASRPTPLATSTSAPASFRRLSIGCSFDSPARTVRALTLQVRRMSPAIHRPAAFEKCACMRWSSIRPVRSSHVWAVCR